MMLWLSSIELTLEPWTAACTAHMSFRRLVSDKWLAKFCARTIFGVHSTASTRLFPLFMVTGATASLGFCCLYVPNAVRLMLVQESRIQTYPRKGRAQTHARTHNRSTQNTQQVRARTAIVGIIIVRGDAVANNFSTGPLQAVLAQLPLAPNALEPACVLSVGMRLVCVVHVRGVTHGTPSRGTCMPFKVRVLCVHVSCTRAVLSSTLNAACRMPHTCIYTHVFAHARI
jgi:hypothetical protein